MGAKPSKSKVERNQSIHSTQSRPASAPTITVDGRSYHNIESCTYFLPRDEEEQDRLNSQHFSLKALYGSNMLSRVEKALPENATILDVGCGSGSWVMDMAIDYPNARVTGLDIMDMFPAMIRPENVTFELANVLDGIPYPDSSFDFVHMRLMISAFRKEEWPFVITEIRRVLKPGGLAQFFESDFTYKGQSPAIDSLISELLRLMEERGQNPWVASQLGEMLKEKAFDHIELDQRKIDYADTVNPISREMLWNWKNVFMSLKPFLNEHLNATSQEYEEIVKQFAKECHQYGWSVNVLGYFAHKPLH